VDFLRHLLLVLHFVGLASLLGGFLVQASAPTKTINNAMWHGALLQLVSGFLLVFVDNDDDHDVDNAKIAVKLGVLVAILVVIAVNRLKETIPVPVWGSIGLLTVANICVAVFWT
jgi:hypothetical protein